MSKATLSKSQINKAGEALVDNPKDKQAMQVLSAYRALHASAVNTFQVLLRQLITQYGLTDTTIAQRLKRTPSIIHKLERFKTMSLARMQDIGGIRVIVPKLDDVYVLHNALVNGAYQHTPLLPPKDYIAKPKADGYRSLHQVFKYEGLHIELQIRTQIQHYWATAVETLGLIEQASFKTGEGSKEYHRFFMLASALFCYQEQSTTLAEFADSPIDEVVSEFIALEKKLQAFDKLQGLIVTGEHITSIKAKGDFYYLMQLNTKTKAVDLILFEKKQLEQAENMYQLLELQNVDNPHIELVLICVKDFKEVQKAYPNYFLDTQAFIANLTKLCKQIQQG